MGFAQAVSTVFRNYVVFDGRARRSEYWWFALFSFIVGFVVELLHSSLLTGLVNLALLLPSLAVAVRRLHDTNRSGWWLLLVLIPIIGWIALLVFYVQDSQPGMNQYGPSPKYPSPDPFGYGAPGTDPYSYGNATGFDGQP